METRTLTLAQCKEYVKNIKDLEISCYQQEKLIRELKNQPNKTKKQIAELEHRIQTEQEPTKPMSVAGNIIFTSIFSIGISLLYGLIGAAIGAIGGIIVCIVLALFFKVDLLLLTCIIWGAAIGGGIVFVPMLFILMKDTKKNAKQDILDYPKKLGDFQKKKDKDIALVENKKKTLELLPNEIRESEEAYRETKDILKSYYDMGFIYPKYRGLVPICTIYEYLESGRCFSLLGHEGAYNLYENELRMNTIIGKLDDVIYRLDEISTNQRILAQEIRKSNAQLEQISRTLDNIESNTALTQYYSRVTAINTECMTWFTACSLDNQRKMMNKLD